jgi:HSP20 family protein
MPHLKIDPVKELEYLSNRMKKFINEIPETFSVEFGRGFEPKVDVSHSDQKVIVAVELPGVAKEQIKLALKDDVLSVSGVKPEIEAENALVHTRQERAFGEFKRSIPLPCEVVAGSINATLADGVLTVTLERKAAREEQEIPINIQ